MVYKHLVLLRFFRLGELLSPTKYDASSHLSFEDVAVDSHSSPSLVKIHLKTSAGTKRDRYIRWENRRHYVPFGSLASLFGCQRCLPGPLFQLQDRKPLTKDYFIQKFRAALTDIGLEASQYAGHSFRIGAATTAAEKGIEDSLIKAMGRWKS